MTWVAIGGSLATLIAEGAVTAGAAAGAGTAAAGIGAGTAAGLGAGALGAGGLAAGSSLMPAGMGAVTAAAPTLAAPAIPTIGATMPAGMGAAPALSTVSVPAAPTAAAAPSGGGGFLGGLSNTLKTVDKMSQPLGMASTLIDMFKGSPPPRPAQPAQARGMQLPPPIDPASLVVSSRKNTAVPGTMIGGLDQAEILKRLGLM